MSFSTHPAFRHNESWLSRIKSLSKGQHLADVTDSYQRMRTSAVLGEVDSEKALSILDVGCGYGLTLRELSRLGYKCCGCDISADLIEYHNAHSPWGKFKLCEVGQPLPFPEEHFDVVISTEVIEHCYDVHGFLVEIRRCLKQPGGRLILTTPYHGVVKLLAIVASGRFEQHFDPTGEHIRFFTVKSLLGALLSCGFCVTCVKGIGRFPYLHKSMLVSSVLL